MLRGLVVACLVLGTVLAYTSIARKSVTVDEFANLPHGLALLDGPAAHVDPGSPPLPRMWSAALVRLVGTPAFDAAPLAERRSSWELGKLFVRSDGAAYARHFLVGRSATIVVWLLACLMTIGYARALYGVGGGVIAGVLVPLAPNLIAHGRLVTPDVHLTAAIVGALWALHGWQERPRLRTLCALGTAIGLAVLSKLTGLLLLVLLPLASLASSAPGERPRLLLRWLPVGLVALLVVNVGYGFAGTGTSLGAFGFDTALAQRVQRWLPGWVPVPLPFELVRGIDVQLGQRGYDSYLLGTFSTEGFWTYYLVALGVKLPVPLLGLGLLATMLSPRPVRRELPLLAVGVGLVLFFSVAGQRNIGLRYVLFVVPLLCVWIARLAPLAFASPPRRGVQGALAAGWVWLLMATVSTWPHYLPFFNVASGGPAAGPRYLLDSNIDWGQDLVALRAYMEAEGIPAVDLAYFGRVPPELYGIPYRSLFDDRVRSSHAVVSVNFLHGRRYFVNGSGYWPVGDAYASFRERTPVAVLGHTLYVFESGAPGS